MQQTYHWKKFILGCTSGNILELYGFILYSFFAPIIANHFFPLYDQYTGLLLTFGIFATGCIARPISALYFGHIGDTLGRKKALIISITLITLSTAFIGLIPTYESIGIWAPILLVICRILQGISLSGEQVGAAVFLMENAPSHRRGLAGAIIMGSVYSGLFIATIITIITISVLPEENLYAWGWRIPFLLALIFGAISLTIRVRQTESADFSAIKTNKMVKKQPVLDAMKTYWPDIIRGIFYTSTCAVGVYLFAVYVPSFFQVALQFSFIETMQICAISFLMISIAIPLVGLLVDKIGPTIPLTVGTTGFLIFAYTIFDLATRGTFYDSLFAGLLLMIFLALVAGSLYSVMLDSFPTPIRYTGFSISFNLSMSIIGSTSPLIAAFMVKMTGDPKAPFLYLALIALISLLAIPYKTRKTAAQNSVPVTERS